LKNVRSALDASLSSGSRSGGFDRGCADGRAAEDSSLSDAGGGGYTAANLSGTSSGSVFHSELMDYGYREPGGEQQAAVYAGGGSVNFTSGLPPGEQHFLPFFSFISFRFPLHSLSPSSCVMLLLHSSSSTPFSFPFPPLPLPFSCPSLKKKLKFSSYIRKFRVVGYNDLLIYGENISAFPHILRSPSSYMTLHPFPSEFPYI
jgi:hypothetical protein